MPRSSFVQHLQPVFVLIAVIWVVEIVNQLVGHALNHRLGLEPRVLAGLVGVPTMPFLHGGIEHAAANSVPLIVLGLIGALVAGERFLPATVAIVLLSGLAVWLFARGNTVHVGASGLIFGWFGYLVTLGIVERSVRTIAGAAAVVAIYGGMVWGVLPQRGVPVSWEAHLFGAAAGAILPVMSRRRLRPL